VDCRGKIGVLKRTWVARTKSKNLPIWEHLGKKAQKGGKVPRRENAMWRGFFIKEKGRLVSGSGEESSKIQKNKY